MLACEGHGASHFILWQRNGTFRRMQSRCARYMRNNGTWGLLRSLAAAATVQPPAADLPVQRRHSALRAALRSAARTAESAWGATAGSQRCGPDLGAAPREAHSIAAPQQGPRSRAGCAAGAFAVDPAVADAVLHLGAVHVAGGGGGESRVPVGVAAYLCGRTLSRWAVTRAGRGLLFGAVPYPGDCIVHALPRHQIWARLFQIWQCFSPPSPDLRSTHPSPNSMSPLEACVYAVQVRLGCQYLQVDSCMQSHPTTHHPRIAMRGLNPEAHMRPAASAPPPCAAGGSPRTTPGRCRSRRGWRPLTAAAPPMPPWALCCTSPACTQSRWLLRCCAACLPLACRAALLPCLALQAAADNLLSHRHPRRIHRSERAAQH